MKAAQSVLVSTLILIILVLPGGTAKADNSVSFTVEVGYYAPYCIDRDFRDYYYPRYYDRYGRCGYYARPLYWRDCHPYYDSLFFDRRCRYGCEPNDYCFCEPLLIERQTIILWPEGLNKDSQELFRDQRNKKNELLNNLEAGNAQQIRDAIIELAGYSFDDTVRAALEKVLLTNPDTELRTLAAQAFGSVKNINALTALAKAEEQDPTEQVRKAAKEAIKKIGKTPHLTGRISY